MDWPSKHRDYIGFIRDNAALEFYKILLTNLTIEGNIVQMRFALNRLDIHDHRGADHPACGLWIGAVDHQKKGFRIHQLTPTERDDHWELWFNDDFSTLKAIPSAQEDWMDRVAFYWAVTPASELLPTVFPGNEAALTAKLKATHEFIGTSKLWHHGLPCDFVCNVSFESIDTIRTGEHKFESELIVSYMWPVELQEVYNFLFDGESWTPSWIPHEPKVINAASSASIQSSGSRVTLSKFPDEDYPLQATCRFTITGEFREVMELFAFPFDSQLLQVYVELPQTSARVRLRTSKEPPKFESLKTSWTFLGGDASLVPDENTVHLLCCVRRNPASYIFRVMISLSLLCGLTLGVFALDPIEDAADRISISLTLLLTAVAYSLVISSMLPELGYLTLLDQVVLWTLAFIALVTLQVILSKKLVVADDVHVAASANSWCLAIDIALLAALTISMAANILCFTLPKENKKLEVARNFTRSRECST